MRAVAHRRRRIALAAATVCAWALLIVSCGSSEVSRADYERELQSITAELEEAWGDAQAPPDARGSGVNASTEQIVEARRRAQLSLRDAANRLGSIAPPSDLASDHDALVAGVRDMADAIDLLIEAEQVADEDPARAKQLARDFATDDSFGAVTAAVSNIEKGGVDAGL